MWSSYVISCPARARVRLGSFSFFGFDQLTGREAKRSEAKQARRSEAKQSEGEGGSESEAERGEAKAKRSEGEARRREAKASEGTRRDAKEADEAKGSERKRREEQRAKLEFSWKRQYHRRALSSRRRSRALLRSFRRRWRACPS
jgi:hypothetical protein